MKLFSIAKVPLFLDNITHGVETRGTDEAKIVSITLRVPDLSAQVATALPDGVRSTLFRLSKANAPKPYLGKVDFRLGLPRQLLHVFAAPDHTKESIALDQCKVVSTTAKADKESAVVSFVVKLSFGPVSKHELEAIEGWRLNERWVTFEEAEPGFFDDDESPAADDTDSSEEDVPLDLDGVRH